MIVEKYVANPAANSFNYVVITIQRPVRVISMNAQNNNTVTTMDSMLFIYRGSITSYDAANTQYAMLLHRASGNVHIPTSLILPPGDYTFGCYAITDIINLHFIFFLQEERGQ